MRLLSVELHNFKKHTSLFFPFENGSNLITGPNYSGKSSVLQGICVGMWGAHATSAALKDLVGDGKKDFKIILKLDDPIKQQVLTIERSMKDASITRMGETAPYVVGHVPVNKEISELTGLDRSTFMKVCSSEQGQPQQLLSMEGAELTRFIESVTKLDKLDSVMSICRANITKSKVVVESLQDRLLEPDVYSVCAFKWDNLTGSVSLHETELAALSSQAAQVTEQQKQLTEAVATAVKKDNDYQVWVGARQRLVDYIAETPERGVPEVDELTKKVNDLSSLLIDARSEYNQAYEFNSALEHYKSEHARIAGAIESLPGVVEADEESLTPLLAELERTEQSLKDVQQTLRDIVQLESSLSDLQTNLIGARSAVGNQTEQLLVDTAEFVKAKETLADQITTVSLEIKHIDQILKGSVCESCKRPFDHTVDLEELKANLVAKTAQQQELSAAYTQASIDLKAVEEANLKAARVNSDLRVYRERVATLEVQEATSMSILAALKDKEAGLPQVNELTATKLQLTAQIDSVRKQVSAYQIYLKELSILRNNLAQLTPVTGEPRDLVKLQGAVDSLSSMFAEASAELKEVSRVREEALKSNAQRKGWLDQLHSTYAEENQPEPGNAEEVSLRLKQVSEDLVTLNAEIQSLQTTLSAERLEVSNLSVKVTQHDEAAERIAEATHQGSLYSFLLTLIENKRNSFLTAALSTLFEVTSEFCRLASNEDISDVFMQDGAICYKEGDKVRPKVCASGAQKSLIGLGMKLGVSELIDSPFETLLLDEISADMSEEISLGCMNALALMAPHTITVTHRKMDIAGNILDLSSV